MKRNFIIIVIGLLCIFLCACSDIENDNKNGDDIGTTVTPQSESDILTIVEKGISDFSIVRSDDAVDDSVEVTCARSIYKKIENLTKFKTELKNDWLKNGQTHDGEAFEILVGNTNYEQTQIAKNNMAYNQFGIILVGNKICIIGNSPESLLSATNKFIEMLALGFERSDEGNGIVLNKSQFTYYNIKGWNNCPPAFEGTVIDGAYDCNDNNYKIFLNDADNNEFNAYKEKLVADGFVAVNEYDISTNRFVTYIKDDIQYQLAFYPEIGEASIQVANQVTQLPVVTDENYTAVTPLVTQLSNLNVVNQPGGMGYLIRLEDSSFIIIDGGFNDGGKADDHVDLYNIIKSQNLREDKKIVIRAWVITHAHNDHYNIMIAFANNYSSLVTLEYLIFNPMGSYYQKKSDTPDGWDPRTVTIKFNGCEYIKATAGQKYRFAGCEVEILMSSDDAFKSRSMYHLNDSSLVIRFKIKEKTFLVTGDIEAAGASRLVEMWGSYLKSDIVQVAHHGCDGGSVEMYKFIQPEVVLWPSSASAFESWKVNYNTNSYLLAMSCVKKVVNAGRDGIFTMELS